MRVLVISDLFPPVAYGGYERECASVVEHLRKRHEVLVLTSDERGSQIPRDSGVLRLLPHVGGSRVKETVRAPLMARRAAQVTRRTLRSFRPDFVYVWESLLIPQAAPAVVAAAGVPMAYRFCVTWAARVFTGDRFLREIAGPSPGLRGGWSHAMRAVNRAPGWRLDATPHRAAVAWVSEALRSASELSPSVEPILERILWPSAQHSDDFSRIERHPSSPPTILFAGRLIEEKGLDIVLRALRILRDRHGVTAHLVVAGTGKPEMVRKLKAMASDLEVASQVRWAGLLGTTELEAALATAGVMVVPSRWDPLPLVCAEAAFARVPLVAASVGGIPEAWRDREHGLLFPADDADACAAAIAETFERPAEAEQRVARASAQALESFGLDSYLAQTDSFIEDALNAFTASAADPAGARAGAR